MIRYVLKTIPHWSILSPIGNNRAIRSTYLWLIIVPILAKIIESLKSVAVKFPENVFIQSLDSILTLPFSWTLLYFAALAFTLANILTNLNCPPLIKNFRNWADFEETGEGIDTIAYSYSTWLRKGGKIFGNNGKKVSSEAAVEQVILEACEDLTEEQLKGEIWKQGGSIKLRKDCELSSVYFLITRQMLRDKPVVRSIISVLYLAGFGLLLFILLLNFIYVIDNTELSLRTKF